MCDLIGIASLAISAASGVMNFMGQQAAYEQQRAMYEQNRQNALAAHRDTQVSMNARQIQEQETAATQKFDTSQEARAARATARVAAGESGVSGFSVEHLMRDMYSRESRFNERVDNNLDWTMVQLQQEKKASGYKAVDRINSVSPGTPPSFADAALRIASGGLNAFTGFQQRNRSSGFNFATG